jgi:hypothetical protein
MKVFINLINQPCRFTSPTQIWYGYNGFLSSRKKHGVVCEWRGMACDPRIYEPTDVLFFKFKTSNKEWKTVTAKDVWIKDRIHNNYLKSK